MPLGQYVLDTLILLPMLLLWLQVLLAAMQSVLLGDSRCANVIIPRICNIVLAAPPSTRHVSNGMHAGHYPAARSYVHVGLNYVAPGRRAVDTRYSELQKFLAQVMLTGRCPAAPYVWLQMLVKWWAEYPPELLEEHVVRPLQKYLTDELYATKKLTVSVMNVIKVR